jgi:hypothetical protein
MKETTMPKHVTDTTDPAIEIVAEPIAASPATHAIVERWWEETFCNIGLDTQLYNRFRAAADRLKILIAAVR